MEGPNSCDVQERLPPSRRAPNMGTSRVQCQHYRRQASAGACGVQCDGVIGCDLSNQGDKVGMTTSTTPHGDHRLTTSHQAKVDRHRLSTRHLKQGISVKRPRDPGRYMVGRYMAGWGNLRFCGVGLILLSGYLWRQQQHSSCSSKQQRVKLANHGP